MTSARDFMQSKIGGKPSGGQVRGKCPLCGSAEGFVYAPDRELCPYKCHACGKTGNATTLGWRSSKAERPAPKPPKPAIPAAWASPKAIEAPEPAQADAPAPPADEEPPAAEFDPNEAIPPEPPRLAPPAAPSDWTRIAQLVANYRRVAGTSKAHRLADTVIAEFGIRPGAYTTQAGKRREALMIYGVNGRPLKRLIGSRWIALSKDLDESSPDFWLGLSGIDTSPDAPIYVAAGEWDLFALFEHAKIKAISPTYGESPRRRWDPAVLEVFARRDVVILYDNDTTGRLGGASLAEAIARHVKAKTIKVVNVAGLGVKAGGDIDDFFALGGTAQRLAEEIAATAPFNRLPSVGESSSLPGRSISFEGVSWELPAPASPDSILPGDVREVVWRAGILPTAARRAAFRKIAEIEVVDPKLIKARCADYSDEAETMTVLAVRDIVDRLVAEYHIKFNARNAEAQDDQLLYFYRDGYYQPLTDEDRDRIADTIARAVTPPDSLDRVSKTRKLISEEVRIRLLDAPVVEFKDGVDGWVNLENGLIKPGAPGAGVWNLEPHGPEKLYRYKIATPWQDSDDCPNFAEALATWFETKDDANEFLKVCWYAMSGKRDLQKAIVFYGPGGDGKGEAVKIMSALIGAERTSSLRLEDISNKHMLESLYGKWLNVADEINRREHISDGIFKAMIGNSPITVDPKYRKPYSFLNKALWIIPTNHQFSTSDNSKGMSRRLKYIRFQTLRDSQKITDFFEKKLRPELPQIMRHIMTTGEGLFRTQGGFTETTVDREMKSDLDSRHSVSAYWQDLIADYTEALNSLSPPPRFFDVWTDRKGKLREAINLPLHYKQYREACKEDLGQMPVSSYGFNGDTRNYLTQWIARIDPATNFIYKTEPLSVPPDLVAEGAKGAQRCFIVETSKGYKWTDKMQELIKRESRREAS